MNNSTLNKKQSHKTTETGSHRIFESLRFSFKHGLIAFFSLLCVLGLVEIAKNLFGEGSSRFIDDLDFALAGLAFILMFLAKFFEQLSRNPKL